MLLLKRSILFIGYWMFIFQAFAQAPPIGSWRVHHSYAGTLEVVQGDKIYTDLIKKSKQVKNDFFTKVD